MKKNIFKRISAFALATSMLLAAGCAKQGEKAPAASEAPAQESSAAEEDSNAQTTAEVTLIAAHVCPEEHSFNIGLEAFKREVEEKSNGRIAVEIHANGELGGNEDELVQKMATGTVDVVIAAPSFMAQSVQEADLFSLPYLFSSVEHWEKAMDGNPGTEMKQIVEEKSGMFKVLGYFKDGVRNMYTINPISNMDDMKDLKFRIQNSPTQIAFWSELGVQPTFISFNEIYQALQNKVIDGAENSFASMYQQKHYEVCKNVTLTEHDVATRFVLISLDKYNMLSDDLKAIIDEAGVVAEKEQRAIDLELGEEYVQELKDSNVTISEIDKEPLIEKTEQVRRDAAKDLNLESMLDEINALK